MGMIIRKTVRGSYKNVAKPLLFRMHPDEAHSAMIVGAKFLSRTRLTRILSGMAYKHPMLEQTVAGIAFKNPVGLSAGLDKNYDLPPIIKRIGMGFEIGGSMTAKVCRGNSKPWFHRLPEEKSIVVHVGLANAGARASLKKIAHYPASLWRDFPLSISVAKTNNKANASDEEAIEDYCKSLRLIEEKNASAMVEINISCPNTYGGEPFTTPERLENLMSAIDTIGLTRPVFVKMPTDKTWTEFRQLLAVLAKHHVEGVTIGNLMKDRAKLKHPEALRSAVKGGLSGLPAQQVTTDLIRQTYHAYRDRFVIIGVGGIFTAEDAYAKIRAGAHLVALVTALMFEGPQVVGEINEGLVRLLKKDGFSSIAEAVGADHKS